LNKRCPRKKCHYVKKVSHSTLHLPLIKQFFLSVPTKFKSFWRSKSFFFNYYLIQIFFKFQIYSLQWIMKLSMVMICNKFVQLPWWQQHWTLYISTFSISIPNLNIYLKEKIEDYNLQHWVQHFNFIWSLHLTTFSMCSFVP